MTIRFVAAMNGTMPAIAAAICTGASLAAVNDNAPSSWPRDVLSGRLPLRSLAGDASRPNPGTLAAALIHLARHGLSTADRSIAKPLAVLHSIKAESHDDRLDICSHLDRRMADAITLRFRP